MTEQSYIHDVFISHAAADAGWVWLFDPEVRERGFAQLLDVLSQPLLPEQE